MFRKKMWVIVAGVGLSLVASGCSSASNELSDTLRVGYVNERPYSWIDGKDVKGTDIDIIKTCMQRTGGPANLEYVQAEFEGLIPGLQGKRFDVIAGGLLYNDERQKLADATSPTYQFRLAAMVQAGNPHGITTEIESLIAAKGRIGAKQGTYDYEVLVKHPELGDRVAGYDSSQSAYRDLANGRIIAVVDNEALVVQYLNANPNPKLEIVQPFNGVYEPAGAVIWFRKGLESTVDKVNGCIKEIKEDGELTKILESNEYPVEAVTGPDETTPNRN
ncbi:ectoine/hydroxyectoine ABC transporter substrate-binding protein EhuB [Micromonospora qiuiae]|uniref:Ectoine/hydroxyectoine ABC transporter substrate-binding protein EhuB n=1 Tax=Micromonospora qiuiae TaxID=502268 RepID=A0ABQ4JIW3_9ACTN|nr:ABC transporter substrate-binding protein [Micromonospora qiuiae]GIJ30533.1 ectoine/hydroxyectoine ABC transporter substrate-binding protein EhuB [Micromonospora qiuiae]